MLSWIYPRNIAIIVMKVVNWPILALTALYSSVSMTGLAVSNGG